MKKWNKTIAIHLGILALLYIILILCTTKFEYIFGSNIDFIRQHAVFPDYFRNLFYETGNLFPDFALHLGGGQNIYYFAYYGFLSPIVLLSYFFPFIEMTTYLIFISIILTFLSTVLLYYFLHKNKFNYSICFISSFLFLFSSCLIFHVHRHLMFVNYMPFLLLALIGVIRYFENKKSFLLIVSIFLMILTSYYFSIPGIISICLYGLYYYLKLNSKATILEIIKAAGLFILRIFLGILLVAFFLLPVAYIILNGRNSNELVLNLSLLIPNAKLDYFMYGTYGVGLTSILWISKIYNLIFEKKEERLLSIFLFIITLIPIINLLLNGGLYSNGKCFIPFLPLYILLISNMLKSLEFKKLHFFLILGISIITSIILLNAKISYVLLFILDLLITTICLFLFNKFKKYIFIIPILFVAFIICLVNNQGDNLITINEYKNIKETNNYDYEKYLEQEDSLYRFVDNKSSSNGINYSKASNDYRTTSYSSTTNPYYTYSFYNTFNNNDIYRNKFMLEQTNNLFFQRFMGIKYLLTDKEVPYGYNLTKTYDSANLYETNNVFPIGFASSNILNKDDYEKLDFNEQLEVFDNNIIIDGDSNNPNLEILSSKINLNYTILNKENIIVAENNKHYLINSKNNGSITLKLETPLIDESLIIRFKMNNIPSCKNGDVAITINGITNKLTCKTWKYYNENETFDYVISNNETIDRLNLEFTKGDYDISNIMIYQIPNSYFLVNKDNISILNVDETMINDVILSGEINVKENGYFIFTIPYDKGFEIKLDDKVIEYELVNEAFIGFKIEKGRHKIELKFNAPYKKYGNIISLATLILTGSLIILEKKKNCNK